MDMIIVVIVMGIIVLYQTLTIKNLTTQLMARNMGEYNQIVDKQIEMAVKDTEEEVDPKYVPINDAEDIPDPVDFKYQEIK